MAGHPLSQTAQLPPLITLEVKSGFAWLYDKYIDQVDENTEANYWNAQEQKRGDTQIGAAHTRLIQDYLGHKNITHTVRYTNTLNLHLADSPDCFEHENRDPRRNHL
ncbi:MAG: hypothetical protein WA869_27255 [Alloacidobacterium sp.]